MKFYEVTEKIRSTAATLPAVRSVHLGNFADIDLQRQTIFPLMHVIPAGANFQGSAITWSFQITLMDLIDWNKEDPRDSIDTYYGINNLQDVLNETGTQMQIFIDDLTRGDEFMKFQAQTPVNITPFYDGDENQVAGWQVTLQITTPSNTTLDGIC